MPPPVRAAAGFGIAYRPETEDDLPFIAALYASTREDELAPLGWPDRTRAAFLDQQHRAQHRHYRNVYPRAEWLIIEDGGVPVGRLYIEARGDSLHLIDIALVPERRGAGLGGAILTDLIDHAEALRKPVSLQVEAFNPARRLYDRLGFRAVGEHGPYLLMERSPAPGS